MIVITTHAIVGGYHRVFFMFLCVLLKPMTHLRVTHATDFRKKLSHVSLTVLYCLTK